MRVFFFVLAFSFAFVGNLVLAAVCCGPSLFAQPSTYVKLGMNHSSFRTEEGKSGPGLSFGFGKEYYPIRSFKGFVGFDFSYVRKKTKLENRTWPSGFDPSDSDVVIGDVNVDIAFLELPLRIGYTILIKQELVVLQLSGGFSASLPIRNHTGGEIEQIIFLEPEEKGKYKFDYLRWDEMTTSISANLEYAVRLVLGPVALGISYSRGLTRTEGFTVQTIGDKLDSFQVTMAYVF